MPGDRHCAQEERVTTVNAKLQLTPRHWYSWQMLPGYFGEPLVPYFSPIWVKEVTPRKTGKGILALGFINTLYAEGVQDFTLDLRILKHEASYLLSEMSTGKKARGTGLRSSAHRFRRISSPPWHMDGAPAVVVSRHRAGKGLSLPECPLRAP